MTTGQKEILEKYKALYGKQTLKKMSEQTGIQLTRMFRLLNGAEMKISEYEVLLKLVNEKTFNPQDPLTRDFEDIFAGLDADSFREFQEYLKSYKRTQELKKKIRSVSNGNTTHLY